MNMHVTPVDLQAKPTKETYDRLQQAYEHFNKALFGGTLPNALITFRARRGTFGYFIGGRFLSEDGRAADEIALNPACFTGRPVKEGLSTLVHEMVHLFQHHHGEPGRGRYHNREWAEKMKAVGLQPTATGTEGGKEIGESVIHLIVPGGAFDEAADKLLAKGFDIVWKEAPEAPGEAEAEGDAAIPAAPRSGQRVRYCCPACDLKAWAKHDVSLICGTDNVPLIATA
jgi:predicted SprT family Zn-dependent metalloprotease